MELSHRDLMDLGNLVHICYILWKFSSPNNFTGMGGAENQLLKMVKQLGNKDNIHITIIAKQTLNDSSYEEISKNRDIYRLKTLNIPIISMLIFMLALLFRVMKINKYKKIDLIHLPLPDIFISIVYILRLILKIPVISRVAADELYPYEKGSYWLINRLLVRSFMLKLDGIQTLNPIAKKHAKYLGYPENKIFLIPNGTKIPKTAKDYQKLTYTLLYIGAMRFNPEKDIKEQKNLLMLIDVFNDLSKLNQHFKLLLVGDGNFRVTLEKRVKELGLDERIIFTGYQKNIQQYHEMADIFINPSWKEGMPNAVVEAMGSGLVVMCSNIPEHQFIINNNDNGILFDNSNKDDLLKNILSFYNNVEKYTKIGVKARQYAIKNLSIEKTVETIFSMYKIILKKNKEFGVNIIERKN